MNKLEQFYLDKELNNEVHTFIIQHIEKRAVEKVFNREDVSALADAKYVLDSAFAEIGEMFKPINKKEVINQSK